MQAPVKREQLGVRNALDAEDERAAASARSAAQGVVDVVELSDIVRKLAAAAGAPPARVDDLEQKARLYVRPLLAACRT